MEKIVITGGLGYIGSELCKLYSGETRFKNITVVDSRFVSERVKQLRDWGFNYTQASILDEQIISEIIKDADVVIHLAGVTDVAYVKTQADPKKDKLITDTAVLGTRNIINNVKKECKIIFPSTHVVYEGFEQTTTDISENVDPCPVLTYAQGKVASEKDFFESDKNYVILRLASVYGYSTDTMRIGIMPNLFAKVTSLNGTIKLFSGGVQLKSLVPLLDVARCMKFMAENKNINRELFHLSKETITVKDVANICKEINPSVTIIETEDEIPNLGYTISNKKLLSTGFKFRYDLKQVMEDMIKNWSARTINPALEYIDRGGKEFVDSRGRINNYELTEPINLIGYIESKKGSVRANHYHPIQEQKCLLIKGQYISVIKDLADPNAKIETRVINEGDIAIIKPNVAHAMIFTEDSIFLNLVRGEREHENYGVTHTISYILVDEALKNRLLESYKLTCRSCDNKHLERVVSLGESPLANNLKNEIQEYTEMYPLEMNYCPKCHNCQLSVSVPAEKMFDNYLYVSSTAASFRKHFEDAAEQYVKEFKLNEDSLIVDIGSNDGIGLKPFQKYGIKVVGVEPAKNIAELSNKNGIPVVNEYFEKSSVDQIINSYGKADLVTASNVFAHSDNLVNIAKHAFDLLKPNGSFVVEVQYLKDTIKDLTFDNIYHEHFNYWSVTSINNFFNNLRFCVYKVEHVNTHGGSIRVYVSRIGCKIDSSVQQFLDDEFKFGITDFETYQTFANNIENIKKIVNENVKQLKNKYNNISAYGSPAKATTSLNYYNIGDQFIDYTVDDNPLKNGKYIPGVNIKIVNKKYFVENLPKVVIVLAWNFFEHIKASNQDLIDKGVLFINIKDLENKNAISYKTIESKFATFLQ
jgi:nucleoside-diphosphate-sugar epimerase/SAM-dependent methyltransferase/quercetin dioxygenase-like cupin family protein